MSKIQTIEHPLPKWLSAPPNAVRHSVFVLRMFEFRQQLMMARDMSRQSLRNLRWPLGLAYEICAMSAPTGVWKSETSMLTASCQVLVVETSTDPALNPLRSRTVADLVSVAWNVCIRDWNRISWKFYQKYYFLKKKKNNLFKNYQGNNVVRRSSCSHVRIGANHLNSFEKACDVGVDQVKINEIELFNVSHCIVDLGNRWRSRNFHSEHQVAAHLQILFGIRRLLQWNIEQFYILFFEVTIASIDSNRSN